MNKLATTKLRPSVLHGHMTATATVFYIRDYV